MPQHTKKCNHYYKKIIIIGLFDDWSESTTGTQALTPEFDICLTLIWQWKMLQITIEKPHEK